MLGLQAYTAMHSFYLCGRDLNLDTCTWNASAITFCTISPVHKHISFDIKWNIGFYDFDYWTLITGEPCFLPTRRGLKREKL